MNKTLLLLSTLTLGPLKTLAQNINNVELNNSFVGQAIVGERGQPILNTPFGEFPFHWATPEYKDKLSQFCGPQPDPIPFPPQPQEPKKIVPIARDFEVSISSSQASKQPKRYINCRKDGFFHRRCVDVEALKKASELAEQNFTKDLEAYSLELRQWKAKTAEIQAKYDALMGDYWHKYNKVNYVKLSLKTLSRDGSVLTAYGEIHGYNTENFILRGSHQSYLGFLFRYRLMSCVDELGEIIDVKTNLTPNSIQEQINLLHNFKVQKFFRCDLEAENLVQQQEILRPWTVKLYDGKDRRPTHRLSITRNDQIQLAANDWERYNLDYQGNNLAQPEMAAALKQSLKNFSRIIHDEYADLLYQLSEDNISAVERQEKVQRFFKENGQEIAENLDTIREHFDQMVLLDKISVLLQINRSYAYVNAIEKALKIHLGLDRTIKSFNN